MSLYFRPILLGECTAAKSHAVQYLLALTPSLSEHDWSQSPVLWGTKYDPREIILWRRPWTTVHRMCRRQSSCPSMSCEWRGWGSTKTILTGLRRNTSSYAYIYSISSYSRGVTIYWEGIVNRLTSELAVAGQHKQPRIATEAVITGRLKPLPKRILSEHGRGTSTQPWNAR